MCLRAHFDWVSKNINQSNHLGQSQLSEVSQEVNGDSREKQAYRLKRGKTR